MLSSQKHLPTRPDFRTNLNNRCIQDTSSCVYIAKDLLGSTNAKTES